MKNSSISICISHLRYARVMPFFCLMLFLFIYGLFKIFTFGNSIEFPDHFGRYFMIWFPCSVIGLAIGGFLILGVLLRGGCAIYTKEQSIVFLLPYPQKFSLAAIDAITLQKGSGLFDRDKLLLSLKNGGVASLPISAMVEDGEHIVQSIRTHLVHQEGAV